MLPETYTIDFDEDAGRALVTLEGELSAQKIGNTFALIALNASWAEGEGQILWQAEHAAFPPSFEFADIFKTTQLSKALTKPGKSAIVVAKSAEMVQRVARFYQGIAISSTPRRIEVFFDSQAALGWLDDAPRSPQ